MVSLSDASGMDGQTQSKPPSIRAAKTQHFNPHDTLSTLKSLCPGVSLAIGIAAISIFTSGWLGGPIMLYALAIGISLNFFATHWCTQAGISYSANKILKIGIALLGVKITVGDVADLGFHTVILIVVAVAATMLVGTWIGRILGLKAAHSILSAGSVAICGSSAALAISSVLPQNKETERNTVLTVIVVTTLSTIAMVLYPWLANVLNLSDTNAGIFMGATIHNVAQVIGAGYIVSESSGDTATVVKLMRVALLVPIIMIIGLMFKNERGEEVRAKRPPLLPLFMVGYVILMLVNSFGLIPPIAATSLATLSHWALVTAVAALGVKTSVTEIFKIEPYPIFVLTLQTVFLALIVLAALSFSLVV